MHKSVLRKILRAAKAPQEYLDAVDAHLCSDCDVDKAKVQKAVAIPRAIQTPKVMVKVVRVVAKRIHRGLLIKDATPLT